MRPFTLLLLSVNDTSFYHHDAYYVIGVMIFIMCFLVATYIYVRHRFAREIAYRKKLVRSFEKELEAQKEEVRKKEAEIRVQRQNLERSKAELERVTSEIEAYKVELQVKEKQLEDKIRQNKSFIKLLHQTELEGSAKDIINVTKAASEGLHTMTDDDWKTLLHAVDKLYPSFNDELIRRTGNADRQELRVCYLMRIGLNNPQIQNVTGLPRTTVWRWVKKYEWIINEDKE